MENIPHTLAHESNTKGVTDSRNLDAQKVNHGVNHQNANGRKSDCPPPAGNDPSNLPATYPPGSNERSGPRSASTVRAPRSGFWKAVAGSIVGRALYKLAETLF